MITPWPHQRYGIDQAIAAIEGGIPTTCLCSPTGGGKTLIAQEIIQWAVAREMRVVLFTNRRQLLWQMQRCLSAASIVYGMRASGFKPVHKWLVQLASMQTEWSRVYKMKTWDLAKAQLILVDEAHLQRGARAEQIIKDYVAAGAQAIGITATPVDIGNIYGHLIVAGRTSELRDCRALLPCKTFAPDEPDCRELKPTKTGEFTEGSVVKAIMSPTIYARVIETHKRINPNLLPAIGFAPSVQTSIWFACEYRKAGIPAAHIDGDDVSYGEIDEAGEPIVYVSDQKRREEVIAKSKSGEIKIVWNRFVLREGIDMPWLYHAVFATVFGALSTFLQAGGRLLRFHPDFDHVIGQDHGGNWWRHGSLNADRDWCLQSTDREIAELRAENFREKKEAEPIRCPKCGMIRAAGRECKACGFVASKSARVVVQLDGTLREMRGDVFKPRVVRMMSDTEKKWEEVYFRCRRKMTFAQARGLFYRENKYWPPNDLPLMPISSIDNARKIKDVPRHSLRPRAPRTEQPSAPDPQQQLSFK